MKLIFFSLNIHVLFYVYLVVTISFVASLLCSDIMESGYAQMVKWKNHFLKIFSYLIIFVGNMFVL